MNRKKQAKTLLVSTLIFGVFLGQLHAQEEKNNTPQKNENSSKGILIADKIQNFYNQTKTVQARFSQSYFHKLYNKYERSKGKVVFHKPGQMRWDYDAPNSKIMIAKKNKLIFFEPGDLPGEPGQLIEQSMGDNQLPLAFSFLLGTGNLSRDFKIQRLDETKLGYKNGFVIELTPKQLSPYYEKMLFFVGSGKIEGVVRRIIIVDAAGNRNQFDFSKFKFDKKIPSDTFNFKAPENVRKIESPGQDQ